MGVPKTTRLYNAGDLGCARRILETSFELRLPLPILGFQVYTYLDHVNSLASSEELSGDPVYVYHTSGASSSYGHGVKLQAVRLEISTDILLNRTYWLIRHGEPF